MGARRTGILILAVLGVVGVILFSVGSLRYGGPAGLALRVRAEISAQLPYPQYVPTPLPTAPRTPAPTLAAPPPTSSPTALPTLTASPEPSQTAPATPAPSRTPAATTGAAAVASAAATATRSSTSLPTLTPRPAGPRVELAGLTHVWQTWNNCGPATLVMDLGYYGLKLTQDKAGAIIRPNKEDKHVGSDELAAYARTVGYQAIARMNGDQKMLKQLLDNGVPVIIATWHEDEKKGGMGHYRLVTGYEDQPREWILYDSLESRGVNPKEPYRGIRIPYDELDRLWVVFNRVYVVVYPAALAPTVLGIVGPAADDPSTWRAALARAEAALKQRPDDPFAWFTLGTNLAALSRWDDAAAAYDRARVIGLPFRMLWYQFGPLQAYYETRRYTELLALVNNTLAQTKEVEELHYWRGLGLEALGDVAGARQELQVALSQRPGYAEAAAALARIGQ